MRFSVWMKRYLKDDNAKGSLARSIKVEGRWFPHNRCRRVVRKYIEGRGADDYVLQAFDECWDAYERENNRSGTR